MALGPNGHVAMSHAAPVRSDASPTSWCIHPASPHDQAAGAATRHGTQKNVDFLGSSWHVHEILRMVENKHKPIKLEIQPIKMVWLKMVSAVKLRKVIKKSRKTPNKDVDVAYRTDEREIASPRETRFAGFQSFSWCYQSFLRSIMWQNQTINSILPEIIRKKINNRIQLLLKWLIFL